MSDILIRGMEMPRNCFQCPLSVLNGERLFCKVTKEEVLRAKLAPECPLIELPPHGDLIETKDVLLALVEHGQRDKRFKLGDTIRYSPSEVKEIIDASVPVIVPAERRESND